MMSDIGYYFGRMMQQNEAITYKSIGDMMTNSAENKKRKKERAETERVFKKGNAYIGDLEQRLSAMIGEKDEQEAGNKARKTQFEKLSEELRKVNPNAEQIIKKIKDDGMKHYVEILEAKGYEVVD